MATLERVLGEDNPLTSALPPAAPSGPPAALIEAPASDRLAWFTYPESCDLPVRVPCDWAGCHNVFVADHPETRAADARRVAVAREGWHYAWSPGGAFPPPFLCPQPHYIPQAVALPDPVNPPPPVTLPGSEQK
jgi:hypothetical protein